MTNGGTIEVGEADGTYRLWLAKEAVRQGERKLTAQEANLLAGEGRAASLLSWSLGILTAIFVAMITHRNMAALTVGCLSALPLVLAQFFCVRALWPKIWSSGGFHPMEIMGNEATSELEALELIAVGYEVAISENEAAFRAFQKRIKLSWCLFFAFVPVGMAGLLLYFFFGGVGGGAF